MALAVVLIFTFIPLLLVSAGYTVYRVTHRRNYPPELTYEQRKELFAENGDPKELERMLSQIKEE